MYFCQTHGLSTPTRVTILHLLFIHIGLISSVRSNTQQFGADNYSHHLVEVHL